MILSLSLQGPTLTLQNNGYSLVADVAASLVSQRFNTDKHITVFSVVIMFFLQGPTLTLRIKGYSLAADVAASQARPRMPPNAFKTAPLVVLNNFAPQQKQLALAASLFQGMFPSINVHNVNLATCQVRYSCSNIAILQDCCVV
jgi:hypothetical protein